MEYKPEISNAKKNLKNFQIRQQDTTCLKSNARSLLHYCGYTLQNVQQPHNTHAVGRERAALLVRALGFSKMQSHINLHARDFYSLQGRIGRIDFILGMVLTGSVPAILYYISRNQILAMENANLYFGFKTFLQLLALSLATPFYVKRFHDLNSPGYWVLLYWVCLPFTIEGTHFIDLIFGIQINPFNEIIMFIGFIGLLMLPVLALKRGNPEENPWGNPNKRIPPDAATLRH